MTMLRRVRHWLWESYYVRVIRHAVADSLSFVGWSDRTLIYRVLCVLSAAYVYWTTVGRVAAEQQVSGAIIGLRVALVAFAPVFLYYLAMAPIRIERELKAENEKWHGKLKTQIKRNEHLVEEHKQVVESKNKKIAELQETIESKLEIVFIPDKHPYLQTDYEEHQGKSTGMQNGWTHRIGILINGESSAQDVRVKLHNLTPLDLPTPVPLHLKGNNTPPFKDKFDLSPGDEGLIDVLYQPALKEEFYLAHIEEGVRNTLVKKRYEMEISVTALNAPSINPKPRFLVRFQGEKEPLAIRRIAPEANPDRPEVIVDYEGRVVEGGEVEEGGEVKPLVFKNDGNTTALNVCIKPLKNRTGLVADFQDTFALDSTGQSKSLVPRVLHWDEEGTQRVVALQGFRQFLEEDWEDLGQESKGYPLIISYTDAKGNDYEAEYVIDYHFIKKEVSTEFVKIWQFA